MINNTWIPKVNEIVSWGCDIARVMCIDYTGKYIIKVKNQYIQTNNMNLPINFTIKQTNIVTNLINDGYKIKKYDGMSLIVLTNDIQDVEINN